MPTEPYFDLETAREALRWLKPKVDELRGKIAAGQVAMVEYDMDLADQFTREIHSILNEVENRGILIRDQEVSLFDFPAVINNVPAYLCWRLGEDDIEFWHYSDTGFTGRNRITGSENILAYL